MRMEVSGLGDVICPLTQGLFAQRDAPHGAIILNTDEQGAASGVGEGSYSLQHLPVQRLLELHRSRLAFHQEAVQPSATVFAHLPPCPQPSDRPSIMSST